MLTSDNYQNYLISSLAEPIESAVYIDAFFEEENPEPQLLNMVLSNVANALGKNKMSECEIKSHLYELETLLKQPTNQGIYNLYHWLNILGLKLTITTVDNEQLTMNNGKLTEDKEEVLLIKN